MVVASNGISSVEVYSPMDHCQWVSRILSRLDDRFCLWDGVIRDSLQMASRDHVVVSTTRKNDSWSTGSTVLFDICLFDILTI